MAEQILRCRKVIERTGLSRSSLYEKMQRGDFPKPRKLGLRAVGWRVSDIESWLERLPVKGGE